MSLKPGDTATDTVTLTDAMVREFARVSGDHNPIHLDDEAARQSRFGRRIVHGMLAVSRFSALLAERLPGPGTVYLSQSVTFSQPIFVGDTVSVGLEVIEVLPERRRARIRTTVRTMEGELALHGEAVVLAPSSCF
jgi:3-hydroxybutyryl-CoA dehydratase